MLKTISKFFVKIFGSQNERELKRLWPIVARVNAFEPSISALSDLDLRKKTDELRERLARGEILDDLLPEAFAAVREASKRASKMRHFDVQLIGGITLHRGRIAEMATGEGKTLVATLAAYLNALPAKGVHIVTVNDYLARRDTQWMGPIYDFLGLKTAVIQHDYDEAYIYDKDFVPDPENKMHNLKPCSRKEAYLADITYGTNNNFGFDYLRDNMKIHKDTQVQRKWHYAIVDEVDSILIDEARTPLIISGPSEESTDKYYISDKIAHQLSKGADYEVKEKEHQVILTENGILKAEKLAGVDSFYTGQNMDWPHHIEQSLRAKELYRLDKDYIVKDGEVIIVDEFTGRLMPGRRWSDGLHQAVEAKENLSIVGENQTLATITLQNYFKMYEKLSGMTGTASTEAMEFERIYKLSVTVIPPNMPMNRTSYTDVIYRTKKEKNTAIIEEIVQVHEQGRPVLVGTTSIENSELISNMLNKRGVKHEVLNAKQHEREAYIVSQAGQKNTVTIATNMAGRGTDIILGEGVAELGGLHVLGTERHEARRIDNQLRGRAGRQGDPGSSRFILALEDDLLRIFAPQWVSNLLQKLGMEEGQPIESRMISNTIEKAQKKMESHNFDIRKQLLEYDEVMNLQRKTIYGQRQEILEGQNVREKILEMIEDQVFTVMDIYIPRNTPQQSWDLKGLAEWFRVKLNINLQPEELAPLKTDKNVEDCLIDKVNLSYQQREEAIGIEHMRQIERHLLLRTIDEKWKEHLYAMDYLRSGIGLKSYAQMDPKAAYKKEGFNFFEQMAAAIKAEVAGLIMRLRITQEDETTLAQRAQPTTFVKRELGQFESAQQNNKPEAKPKPIVGAPKYGRNDPCPCGSGKKYKKCCGQRS
ncbi:MAG: preprotein translocase subunit SecA [Planctomycetes bacterium]|nr:preprotein translocase subunit SecA [Planctomycetota bacterium]